MRLCRNRWTALCGCAFEYDFDGDVDGDVSHSNHEAIRHCARHALRVTAEMSHEERYHLVLEEVKRLELTKGQILQDHPELVAPDGSALVEWVSNYDEEGHLTLRVVGAPAQVRTRIQTAEAVKVQAKIDAAKLPLTDDPAMVASLDAVGLPVPDLARVTIEA